MLAKGEAEEIQRLSVSVRGPDLQEAGCQIRYDTPTFGLADRFAGIKGTWSREGRGHRIRAVHEYMCYYIIVNPLHFNILCSVTHSSEPVCFCRRK